MRLRSTYFPIVVVRAAHWRSQLCGARATQRVCIGNTHGHILRTYHVGALLVPEARAVRAHRLAKSIALRTHVPMPMRDAPRKRCRSASPPALQRHRSRHAHDAVVVPCRVAVNAHNVPFKVQLTVTWTAARRGVAPGAAELCKCGGGGGSPSECHPQKRCVISCFSPCFTEFHRLCTVTQSRPLHGHPRSSTVMHGHARSCAVMRGHARSSTVMHGHARPSRSCTVIGDHPGHSTVMHGPPWPSPATTAAPGIFNTNLPSRIR
eukprot:gene24722-biopygen22418